MENQIAGAREYYKGQTLDELLDDISVMEIDEDNAELNGNKGIVGWYGVVTHVGIIAYFGNEKDAFRFRLDYINRILNP